MYGPVAKVTIIKNPGGAAPKSLGTAIASYEDALAQSSVQAQAAWHVTPSPAQAIEGEEFYLPALRSLQISEGVGEPPKINVDLVVSMMDRDTVERLMASGVLESGSVIVAQLGYPSSNTWTRPYRGITQIPSVTIGDDSFVSISVPASGFSIVALRIDVSGMTFPGKSKLDVIRELATMSGISGVDISGLNEETSNIIQLRPPAAQTGKSKVPAPFEVISQGESAMAAMIRIASTAKCDVVFGMIEGREAVRLVPTEAPSEPGPVGKVFRFFGTDPDHIQAKGFTTESPLYWIPGVAASRIAMDLDPSTKSSISQQSGGGADATPATAGGQRVKIERRTPESEGRRGRDPGEALRSTANAASPDQLRSEASAASKSVPIAVGVKGGWSFQGRPIEIFERVQVRGLPSVVEMPGGWVVQSASHQYSDGNWETSVSAFGTGVPGHQPAKTKAPPATQDPGAGDGRVVKARPG